MEEIIDVESYYYENPEGDNCVICGQYFKFYELQLYKRTDSKNEYICFTCFDVFQD